MFVIKESARDIWLLVLVVVMSIAANLPDEVISRISIDKRYLLVGLTIVLMFSLLRYVRIGLVLVTLVLVVGANLPAELAKQLGIDQAVLTFTLVSLVVLALVNRITKMQTGLETKQVARSVYGAKALFSAVLKGHVSTVEHLIRSGANVNVRTVSGKTPLMAASYRGYADIVQMLVAAGADVNVVDAKGNTAMSIGKRMKHSRVVTLLEIAGADKNQTQQNPATAQAEPVKRSPISRRGRYAATSGFTTIPTTAAAQQH